MNTIYIYIGQADLLDIKTHIIYNSGMTTKITAQEDIRKGQEIEMKDGLARVAKEEKPMWWHLGFKTESQAIATLSNLVNIAILTHRNAKKNNKNKN